MMKSEFEKLAGYEVSNSDYIEIIEPMYMATNLSKEEFIGVQPWSIAPGSIPGGCFCNNATHTAIY